MNTTDTELMYKNELAVIIADMKNCQIRKDIDIERLLKIVMCVYYCFCNYDNRLS